MNQFINCPNMKYQTEKRKIKSPMSNASTIFTKIIFMYYCTFFENILHLNAHIFQLFSAFYRSSMKRALFN